MNTTIKQYGDGTQLVQLVRDMVVSLDRLGFDDEDAPVDGGDCVELMGALLPQLREALVGHDRLSREVPPLERKLADALRLTQSSLENWVEIQDEEDARDCDDKALEAASEALAEFDEAHPSADGDAPESPRP